MSEQQRDLPFDGQSVAAAQADDTGLAPLPGEMGIPNVAETQRAAVSKKGLLAVGLLVGSLIAVSAVGINRFASGGKKAEDSKLVRDKPAAASAEPRRLDMQLANASPPSEPVAPRVPAIQPMEGEAEPIGVRRSGAGSSTAAGPAPIRPEDAPVLLVTARVGSGSQRLQVGNGAPAHGGHDAESDPGPHDPLTATTQNLQAYQRQLQGVLENLTRTADLATNSAAGNPSAPPPSVLGSPNATGATQQPGLFGGQLQGSATPRAIAGLMGNSSLTLPKGTAFNCALKTKVISATSGLVGCQVQRNVFGTDGRVLLIERGSHLDGEYRITSIRPGLVRIPVLWTRIRTPLGVTVDIESPATGQLGESGIDGYVDNRWSERIGAALLLSLIDDSVKMVIQSQAGDRQGDTILLPSTTANGSKLAEKVLDSTINIPPLIYQNQGGVVGIYVSRDVDFSSVYELRPTPDAVVRR